MTEPFFLFFWVWGGGLGLVSCCLFLFGLSSSVCSISSVCPPAPLEESTEVDVRLITMFVRSVRLHESDGFFLILYRESRHVVIRYLDLLVRPLFPSSSFNFKHTNDVCFHHAGE